MQPLHEVAARANVRQERDKKCGADPIEICRQEHRDDGVEGELSTSGSGPCERYYEPTPVNANPARFPTIITWSLETFSSIHGYSERRIQARGPVVKINEPDRRRDEKGPDGHIVCNLPDLFYARTAWAPFALRFTEPPVVTCKLGPIPLAGFVRVARIQGIGWTRFPGKRGDHVFSAIVSFRDRIGSFAECVLDGRR